ncbi:MAG: S-ribosylhomocysteine lyase [Clostridia bacterium]|nr:S-ribosylhomocysteine lyase [Clostridia bacterium]
MNRIASFTVDHRKIDVGMYISRIDGDVVTYDLRMRRPNQGDLLSNGTMHSLEHMFATLARNSRLSDKVIYFGPMGCQTGFYLLMRHENHADNLALVKELLLAIMDYDGEMPGNSEIECGNYRNLDMSLAKAEAKRYYDSIKDQTVENMRYA